MRTLLGWIVGSPRVSQKWLREHERFESTQSRIYWNIWLTSEKPKRLRALSMQRWKQFAEERRKRA